jgi:K+/H+ antiporter YhaU regulatory subunit KhtT
MSVLTVSENSPLVGSEVGAVDVPVVALRAPDGVVEAVPPRTRVLSEGDTVYAVGRPEELRKLETTSGDG